jgi:sortase A
MLGSARFEALLWMSGTLLLGYGVCVGRQATASRRAADAVIAVASAPRSSRSQAAVPDGESDVIGRLEIPALRFSVPITADFDAASLRRGVGYVRGTAMLGGLGTVGLVGHRDSFFRPLRQVAAGMEIRLADKTGRYRYSIDGTEVVNPETVEVLDVTNRPELTLVTCFPFDYVGRAPKRFIVHAHLLSVAPEEPGAP